MGHWAKGNMLFSHKTALINQLNNQLINQPTQYNEPNNKPNDWRNELMNEQMNEWMDWLLRTNQLEGNLPNTQQTN